MTTPPARAREIATGIVGSRIIEIPDCAHCPPIERPEEFARVIGAFLTEAGP